MLTIGFDAKRIVRNGTGLGSYGRTLVNDIARLSPSLRLRLYAPDQGRDDLRSQITATPNLKFCYPKNCSMPFDKAIWRSPGIVKDLKKAGRRRRRNLLKRAEEGTREDCMSHPDTV